MNQPGFTIRQLVRDDAMAFKAIRLEGLETHPDAFGSDFAFEAARPIEWFAERLTNSQVFGASRPDGLIGVAGLEREAGAKRAHKAFFWGMYVRPDARRIGVGRALVDAVLGAARECAELIQLGVASTNEPAQRLYAAAGFRAYGLEKDALKVGDHYVDEILMARDLRQP